MSNFLSKMRGGIVLATGCSLLAACVAVPDHQTRQADGELAGKVVVFTDAELDGETVSVFVDDKFVAALPAKHQLSHGLCEGQYELKARSVLPTASADNKILHVVGGQSVQVEKGQVQYFNLQRKAKGWEFVAVDQIVADLKMSDDKLVRRMSDQMLQCK